MGSCSSEPSCLLVRNPQVSKNWCVKCTSTAIFLINGRLSVCLSDPWNANDQGNKLKKNYMAFFKMSQMWPSFNKKKRGRPVDNRPSTKYLICDMWQITPDTSHVTLGTWHLTCGGASTSRNRSWWRQVNPKWILTAWLLLKSIKYP